MNDLDLKVEVKEALDWEPALDARSIHVSVKDGVVALTGSVPGYLENTWRKRPLDSSAA